MYGQLLSYENQDNLIHESLIYIEELKAVKRDDFKDLIS